jgi:hypothetical protein
MGDFAALQQDVVDRTLREAAAHRKSRVPRTDNDGGDSAHRAVLGKTVVAAAISSPRR